MRYRQMSKNRRQKIDKSEGEDSNSVATWEQLPHHESVISKMSLLDHFISFIVHDLCFSTAHSLCLLLSRHLHSSLVQSACVKSCFE